MTKRCIVGIAVVLIVAGSYFAWREWMALNTISLPLGAQPRLPWMASEQRRVYEAVIEQFYVAKGLRAPIVIDDRTLSPTFNGLSGTPFVRAAEGIPKLSRETWASYEDANRSDEAFLVPMALSLPSVIDTTKITTTTWDEFFARYPSARGRLALSRVGFNDSGNQALVYVWHAYGNLGAEGRAFLLEKESGKWMVVQAVLCAMA